MFALTKVVWGEYQGDDNALHSHLDMMTMTIAWNVLLIDTFKLGSRHCHYHNNLQLTVLCKYPASKLGHYTVLTAQLS